MNAAIGVLFLTVRPYFDLRLSIVIQDIRPVISSLEYYPSLKNVEHKFPNLYCLLTRAQQLEYVNLIISVVRETPDSNQYGRRQ